MDQTVLKYIVPISIKEIDDENRVIKFVGSTTTQDRSGDIIEATGWKLSNYMKNPVFLWSHNRVPELPPIGRTVELQRTTDNLVFNIEFATKDLLPFADTIYKMYRAGFIRAVSVGFIPTKREIITDPATGNFKGFRFTEQELVELSAVNVPDNPEALIQEAVHGTLCKEAQDFLVKSLHYEREKTLSDIAKEIQETLEEKSVIGFKHYPLASKDMSWDGPAQKKQADPATLKIICTWYDSENSDVKSSYKLPHHLASNKHTVWRGVTAAMGALLGARGGTAIPSSDRKGVYNHLARHYREFDETPPEFREYDETELKGMFPELYEKGHELMDVRTTAEGGIEVPKEFVEPLTKFLKEGGMIEGDPIKIEYNWKTGETIFTPMTKEEKRQEDLDNWRQNVDNTLKELQSFQDMQKSATEMFQVVKGLLDNVKSDSNAQTNPFLKALASGTMPNGDPKDDKALVEMISKMTQRISSWKPAQ